MNDKSLAGERRLLKKYLSNYFRAKEKQDVLDQRLQNLRCQGHDLEAEIETLVKDQVDATERSILEVMEIMAFLPPNSTERIIMELRHLDCKSWRQIQRTVHLTASPCFDHYNRGLDALLSMDKVRRLVGLPEKMPRK